MFMPVFWAEAKTKTPVLGKPNRLVEMRAAAGWAIPTLCKMRLANKQISKEVRAIIDDG